MGVGREGREGGTEGGRAGGSGGRRGWRGEIGYNDKQKGERRMKKKGVREYMNVGREKNKESKFIDRVNQQQASKQP